MYGKLRVGHQTTKGRISMKNDKFTKIVSFDRTVERRQVNFQGEIRDITMWHNVIPVFMSPPSG